MATAAATGCKITVTDYPASLPSASHQKLSLIGGRLTSSAPLRRSRLPRPARFPSAAEESLDRVDFVSDRMPSRLRWVYDLIPIRRVFARSDTYVDCLVDIISPPVVSRNTSGEAINFRRDARMSRLERLIESGGKSSFARARETQTKYLAHLHLVLEALDGDD